MKIKWYTDSWSYANNFMHYARKHDIQYKLSCHDAANYYTIRRQFEYGFVSWLRLLPYWPLYAMGFFHYYR